MDIVLATHNPHKVKEITAILQDTGIAFRSLRDFPGAPPILEDGATFEANARKKAYGIACFTHHLSLADDSGLEVPFLKGAPGVYSARFAGPGCTYAQNNEKLLSLLKGVATEHRQARFRCVIALASPEGLTRTAEGVLEGALTEKPRGDFGFGYDPVFLIPKLGKTLAQIPPAQKNTLSHRFRALQAIRPILLDFASRYRSSKPI